MLPRNVPMKRSPMPPRKRPLRYRSAKTAAKYVKRGALVAELMLYPQVCEVPDCTERATDPHEPLTRARGGDILDRANIRLICAGHHREIHDKEPAWAYEQGFLRKSGKAGAA